MQPVVEIKKLKKSYDGRPILNGIDMRIFPGSIHGLYGLNGVGKTTLINILAGIRTPDSGEIFINGKSACFSAPSDSIKAGIAAVFQNCDAFQNLTVAEYLHLCTTAPARNQFKMYSVREIKAHCRELLDDYELSLNPSDRMSSLSSGKKQLFQILAALSTNPQFLMLDEPYSMLSFIETDQLFNLFLRLKSRGIALLIVSHDTNDLAAICDEVTVLSEGNISAHYISGTPEFSAWADEFNRRNPIYAYPYISKSPTRTLLAIENVSTKGIIRNVTFQLKKGEVLGVSGLLGSGKTSLAHVLFGAESISSGRIVMNGTPLRLRSPADAIKSGIALVSADMVREGIIFSFSVSNNISLPNLQEISRPLLSITQEEAVALKYIKNFVIKTPSAREPIRNLSTGNQQKVNIIKWLFSNAKILIMDDPTQYLDICNKVEIYNFMNKFTSEGGSILFISSDLDELLGMSDRLLVMKHGHVVQTLTRSNFSSDELKKFLH